MKDGLINACKRLKILWDTYKIVKAIIVFLGLIGVGGVGYFTYESEPVTESLPVQKATTNTPAPVIIDCRADIQKAIKEYDKKHDPQKLGH